MKLPDSAFKNPTAHVAGTSPFRGGTIGAIKASLKGELSPKATEGFGRLGRLPLTAGRLGRRPLTAGRQGRQPLAAGRQGRLPPAAGRQGRQPPAAGRQGRLPPAAGRQGRQPLAAAGQHTKSTAIHWSGRFLRLPGRLSLHAHAAAGQNTTSGTINWSSRSLRFSGAFRKTPGRHCRLHKTDSRSLPVGRVFQWALRPVCLDLAYSHGGVRKTDTGADLTIPGARVSW